MPYFVVFKNSSQDQIIKMIEDKGRMNEAVDEAIRGEYLSEPIVGVYHCNNFLAVNTEKRIRYAGRNI